MVNHLGLPDGDLDSSLLTKHRFRKKILDFAKTIRGETFRALHNHSLSVQGPRIVLRGDDHSMQCGSLSWGGNFQCW